MSKGTKISMNTSSYDQIKEEANYHSNIVRQYKERRQISATTCGCYIAQMCSC
jgi:hypothetical protein